MLPPGCDFVIETGVNQREIVGVPGFSGWATAGASHHSVSGRRARCGIPKINCSMRYFSASDD